MLRRVHVLSSGTQGFSAKLAPKYEGSYEILERKFPTVYVLRMKGKGVVMVSMYYSAVLWNLCCREYE